MVTRAILHMITCAVLVAPLLSYRKPGSLHDCIPWGQFGGDSLHTATLARPCTRRHTTATLLTVALLNIEHTCCVDLELNTVFVSSNTSAVSAVNWVTD